MKFNCDNCGAQYLIADEKLGSRGVKVRCKKCSYVIILRPDGFDPSEAKAGDGKKNGRTNGSSNGHDTPAVVATTPLTRSAPADATIPGDVVAQTSSDFGLSQEFMALGFDDDGAPVAPSRNMSLSVGLDVNRMAEGVEAHSSPFSSERTGGSLDFVPDAPGAEPEVMKPYGDDSTEVLDHIAQSEVNATLGEVNATRGEVNATLGEVNATLGHAHPQIDPQDDDAATRVESRDVIVGADESEAFEPLASTNVGFDEEPTANYDEPEPPRDPAPMVSAVDEEDALASLAAAAMADDDEPNLEKTASEGDEYGAALDAAIADQSEHTDQGPSFGGSAELPPDPNSDDILSALSDVEKDEMDEMRSSIAGELDGLSSEIAPFADDNAEPANTAVGPPPDAVQEEPEAQLSADSADEDGMQDEVGAGLETIGESDGGLLGHDESVEAELGDAFAAMFDGPGGPDLGLGDVGDAVAEEDEAAALAALAAADGNKAETRVFDTEAMAQVQAEQDIAGQGEAPSDVREWYVAINDEQVGPLNVNEVQAKWMTGEVGPNSLCWKQGMGDWTAIRFTEGLEAVREQAAATPEPPVEDSMNLGMPPEIAPEPTPEPRDEPVVSPVADDDDDDDDGGWRPSAASALASLAAEELSDNPSVAPLSDVAAGPAIPATSTALQELLEGEAKVGPGAEMFGAAEKSESAVRPLPRRADTVSSVPLRDPTIERQRQSYLIPLAILGGFLLLALTITGTILFMSNSSNADEPANPIASNGTAAGTNQNPNNAVAAPPNNGMNANAVNANGTAAPPPAGMPPPVAPPAATAPPPVAPPVAAVMPPKSEKKEPEVEKEPPKKRRTKRTRRPKRETEPPPPPPPPPPARRAGTEEDDLLGGTPKRRTRQIAEPSSSLPRQLDDSDVLSVIRKNRNAVRTCMQKQSAADPALDGTMTVRMVIRKSGRPTRVNVTPDKFKSSVVGRCVVSSVKGWRFPKFSGPKMPIDFPVRVRGR